MVMDLTELNHITPYPAINTLLVQWVGSVKRLFGDKVVGLYLAGSLTYGDFVPERSDIDLQAVVQDPLTEDELKSVEQLHREIEQRCPEWANRIECSYVPLALMRELRPPATARPWWGFGTFYAAAPAGNEWIINHYLLSKYGIALDGSDFNRLVPRIGIQDVKRATVDDLFTEWVPKMNDRAWLSNSYYQSYLVMNLCRILCTAIGGEARSKRTAGEWAKAASPAWRDLIDEAERWRYGDEMKRQDDAVAFIRFAVERVGEIYTPRAF
jgi:hypothetical protein